MFSPIPTAPIRQEHVVTEDPGPDIRPDAGSSTKLGRNLLTMIGCQPENLWVSCKEVTLSEQLSGEWSRIRQGRLGSFHSGARFALGEGQEEVTSPDSASAKLRWVDHTNYSDSRSRMSGGVTSPS